MRLNLRTTVVNQQLEHDEVNLGGGGSSPTTVVISQGHN
jgi:hypothetical protein